MEDLPKIPEPEFKKGDRVRLKKNHKATGEIDETFEEDGQFKASVVWDISGCVGEGAIEDIEKYTDPKSYPNLTGYEYKCMSAWFKHNDRDFSILSFIEIATRAEIQVSKVRRAIRALTRKGLTEFHRVSFDQDGHTAGAGYCPTAAGWSYIDMKSGA